ncbi:unannotated protein [freshwater metagenome]|uniref:Unannotated protein n=1 Tax=freshwater metagenome TaxID=449393 RepID=A0A6J7TMK5_9ZZZZ
MSTRILPRSASSISVRLVRSTRARVAKVFAASVTWDAAVSVPWLANTPSTARFTRPAASSSVLAWLSRVSHTCAVDTER